MRTITSEEVANITQLWEPVHIINLESKTRVGSVPRDLVAPNHMHGFSQSNRQMLTRLFEQAFDSGCRHIGFVAPDYLYDTMFNSALDVAEDRGGDWQVSPVEQDEYQDLVNQARLKILAESAAEVEDQEISAQLDKMEEELCDAMGLNTEAILQLYGMGPETVAEAEQYYQKALADAQAEQQQAPAEEAAAAPEVPPAEDDATVDKA